MAQQFQVLVLQKYLYVGKRRLRQGWVPSVFV